MRDSKVSSRCAILSNACAANRPNMDPISPHDPPLGWIYRSCETLRSHRAAPYSQMLARPIDGTAFIAPVMDPISPHDPPLCWLYRSCKTLRSHRAEPFSRMLARLIGSTTIHCPCLGSNIPPWLATLLAFYLFQSTRLSCLIAPHHSL
jgi:hypothetical protein